MSIYYVYKLQNPFGPYYFGVRSCSCSNPYDDLGIKYKSSSLNVAQIGFHNFYYGVVQTYDTRKEAYDAEHQLIREHIDDPMCLNMVCTPRKGVRRNVGYIMSAGKKYPALKLKAHRLERERYRLKVQNMFAAKRTEGYRKIRPIP